MNLCEWDAKSVLRSAGFPVPRAQLIELEGGAVPEGLHPATMIKAQLLQGGRGKLGLVQRAGPRPEAVAAAIAGKLAGIGVPPVVMLEDAVAVAAELYLAVSIDDVAGVPVLLFSASGGVDVEEDGRVASFLLPPDRQIRAHELLAFLRSAGAPDAALGRIARSAADLHRLMRENDARLIEINPLGLTPQGRLMALDCKMVLDGSAAFRRDHDRFALSARLEIAALTPAERDARVQGYTLVQTPGDVVLLTAGAGLGMLCADLLADAGFRAATFFDNAADSRADTSALRLDRAWQLSEDPQCRAIMYYLALSSRDLAPRVRGLIERLNSDPPRKPFYFGLTASAAAEREMTAAAARDLVRSTGYPAFANAEDLVRAMAADRDAGRWPGAIREGAMI